MDSMQCHKPATYEACPKTCQNKPANESSLGQKVSEMAGFLKGGHHGQHSSSHTPCSATATNDHGQHGLTQHHATNGMAWHGNYATNGAACHGRTKKEGEHRNKRTGGGRNLLHKIKNGISGHSSESDSSDSDSDNEGCCRKKN